MGHVSTPPFGYEFVKVSSGDIRGALGALRSTLTLWVSALRNGANLKDATKFIMARDIGLQFQIPSGVRLVYLPGLLFIVGQVPWVIIIEDWVGLFYPTVSHGHTARVEISKTRFYPGVKALLQSESCKGIISHVKSTAESIPILFQDASLAKKTIHIPMGIKLPPVLPSRAKPADDVIRILFTNSWHQAPRNFYLRGGLDLLEAFSILASKYSNVRLTLRTALPADLDPSYLKIIKSLPIEVVDRKLPREQMDELLLQSDIFVLPSARIHVVSILQAMAFGVAVVVSDGWGIQEYVEDGWNGAVVRGRYGKCSWMDANGILREDYRSLWSPDPVVVRNLVESLSALIEDENLRRRLGQNARRDVETRFSIDNWNQGLKKAFDQALGD